MTQRQLARRMGISVTTWQRWENKSWTGLIFEPDCPARIERLLRKVELDPHRGVLREHD
jgi:transcriptional regulator with XRE-family HTH domain